MSETAPSATRRGLPPSRRSGLGVITNVQLLRFVAAAVVLYGHTVAEAVSVDPAFNTRVPWRLDFSAGVDVFFVVSGFVMLHTSYERFGRVGATPRFLQARLLRVAPPYWIATLVMLAAIAAFPQRIAHSDVTVTQVVTSFLFIPWEDGGGSLRPVLRLGWTLNYEVFFYVLFGLALLVRRRAVALVGLGVTFVALALLHPHVPATWWPLLAWTDPIIFEFLFGVAVGLVARRGLRLPAWAAAAVMVAAIAGWVLARDVHLDRQWEYGLPAALLCLAAVCGPQVDAARRGVRGLVIAGDASYALYLSHPFTINAVLGGWAVLGLDSPWAFVAVACLVAVGASVVVHLRGERPLLAALRARWGPSST